VYPKFIGIGEYSQSIVREIVVPMLIFNVNVLF